MTRDQWDTHPDAIALVMHADKCGVPDRDLVAVALAVADAVDHHARGPSAVEARETVRRWLAGQASARECARAAHRAEQDGHRRAPRWQEGYAVHAAAYAATAARGPRSTGSARSPRDIAAARRAYIVEQVRDAIFCAGMAPALREDLDLAEIVRAVLRYPEAA